MLGNRLGVAAGLVDHQDAALGAGLHIDGVVAGAVGRHDQEVRRLAQEIGVRVIVPRQLVAGRTGLIGMRGGKNGCAAAVGLLLPELIEPHVAALAEDFAIALRPVRRHAEDALIVDDSIH